MYDTKTLSCLWNRIDNDLYAIMILSVTMCLPCLCVFVCYMRIYYFVAKTIKKVAYSKRVTNGGAHTKLTRKLVSKDTDKSISVARTLFAAFLLFSLSW